MEEEKKKKERTIDSILGTDWKQIDCKCKLFNFN